MIILVVLLTYQDKMGTKLSDMPAVVWNLELNALMMLSIATKMF
jgi:hypothetical protein